TIARIKPWSAFQRKPLEVKAVRTFTFGHCHGCMRGKIMSKLTFSGIIPNAPVGRFDGINRPYSAEDVMRLRGSFQIRYSLAERGANRLWDLLHSEPYLPSLGAVTGNQAMQMVRAGLQAIYLSGWQVAA